MSKKRVKAINVSCGACDGGKQVIYPQAYNQENEIEVDCVTCKGTGYLAYSLATGQQIEKISQPEDDWL